MGVYLDPRQIETALINLVTKTKDAIPKGGTIMIEIRNILI